MTAAESVLPTMRQLFADCLGVPAETITADSTPDTLEGWDSIRHLQLLVSVEETFGVEFTAEEMSSLSRVLDITEAVAGKVRR